MTDSDDIPRELTLVGIPLTRAPALSYADLYALYIRQQAELDDERLHCAELSGRLTLAQGVAVGYGQRNARLRAVVAAADERQARLVKRIEEQADEIEALRKRCQSAVTQRIRRPATHPDHDRPTRPFVAVQPDHEYPEVTIIDDPDEPMEPGEARRWNDETATPAGVCMPMSDESGPKVHVREGYR